MISSAGSFTATFALRAERNGNRAPFGAARIYTVTIVATDISEATGGEVTLLWIVLTGPPPFV